MLIQYSVKNYKSIKEEVVINFSAEGAKNQNDWIVDIPVKPYKLYKIVGLFGPNASGKSNIIESMEFAFSFINNTIMRKEESKISITPFLLDKESKNKNTEFEFIYFSNKVKYVYGFVINFERVEEEYLLAYYSAKPTTIFNRKNCEKYNFKGNDEIKQKEYKSKTSKNRLYLPVAAEWGYSKAKEALHWFNLSYSYRDFNKPNEIIVNTINNKSQKKLLLEMLKCADFNISDIYVKKKAVKIKSANAITNFFKELGLPEEITNSDFRYNYEIYITHLIENGAEYSLDIDEDSSGTQLIVNNFSELINIGMRGGLLTKDEFGTAYHTKLSEHYMKRFANPKINKGNGQLLFNSHDKNLLNLFDPTQIYLIDKCEEGYTCVASLSDFNLRKDENIELGYTKGRYSAIPHFKEIL